LDLQEKARRVAETELHPNAEAIDRERRFPLDNLNAVAQEGLFGILIPPTSGGSGSGLTELALVCEELGMACASTAMCFLMHTCGSAVIAAKATPEQASRWLSPASAGDMITTLAFSERGTGAHFYQPEISAERKNGSLVVSGRKSFVTSGGHAHLYPVLVNASGGQGLTLLVLTPDMPGVHFEGEWDGIGMAGNSSIVMSLADVEVPADHVLGNEGDGQEVVFNVVAPTFLIGLAAVNVGIARAALNGAIEHARTRRYPSGRSLAEIETIQGYLARMSILTESARLLVLEAARAADAGEPTALPLVMQAKIAATESAKHVTDLAMQVGGGQAYSRQLPVERHWRDARAGSVMAPTNEVLQEWLGKALCGLPLF
jgi:alkylation response protein AidB-like acyl-CoA dehydrogenase